MAIINNDNMTVARRCIESMLLTQSLGSSLCTRLRWSRPAAIGLRGTRSYSKLHAEDRRR